MEIVDTPTNPSPRQPSRWFHLRLALSVILLLPAIWFSWRTIDGLAARRLIRTDLAEIQHARYGILSADQWRTIIGPILNAQVDKLNLTGQSNSLRPMVERSLYALLDNIKTQMTTKQPTAPKAPAKPAAANPMLVNMIVASLRPHVPEYTNVVMAELAKPQTQKSFKDSIRAVLADAVKNTFGSTDMTTYNAILKRYGCSSGAVCQVTLGNKIAEADKSLNSRLSHRASIGGARVHPPDGRQAHALARRRRGADALLHFHAGRRRAQPHAGGRSPHHQARCHPARHAHRVSRPVALLPQQNRA